MIASRTIQHNGDKLSKKWDLETSNEETEPKIKIYAKNWARQALLENLDFGQSQRSTVWDADVGCWRGSMTSL